jgi:hypothetical protein
VNPITHTFSYYPTRRSDKIQKDYKDVQQIFTYAERVKKQPLVDNEEFKEESVAKRQRTE